MIEGIKSWFAKITKKSAESGDFAVQQGTYLGRVTDMLILFPYGMHANLPVDQYGIMLDEEGRVFMGTSMVGRITVAEGEVVFYHPQTKSKIHFKADNSINLDASASSGNVNVTAAAVNITTSGNMSATVGGNATVSASGNATIDGATVNLGSGGAAIARLGDQVTVGGVTGTITTASTKNTST